MTEQRPSWTGPTWILCLAFLLALGAAAAAEPQIDLKSTGVPPTSESASPWEFTAGPPIWGAGMYGDIAINGISAQVDLGPEEILRSIDMYASLNVEARKGRWGGWIEGLYMRVSGGAESSGTLFESAGLSMKQLIAEAAMFYRVVDGERLRLDVYAGARYMYISGELNLSLSDSGVADLSRDLSGRLVEQVSNALRGKTDAALTQASEKVADQIAAQVSARVADTVTGRIGQAKARLAQIQDVAEAFPNLAEILRDSERLKAAIREAAEAGVQARLAELQDAAADAQAVGSSAKAALSAAANRARSKASSASAKVEKTLAKAIEKALRESIPSQASGSVDWVDPFVGLRAYYDMTDRLYLVAKGDIGGFGVGSDLTWQLYGAIGYHLNQSKTAAVELGWKYMAIDYAGGSLLYDVDASGAMLNFSFKF